MRILFRLCFIKFFFLDKIKQITHQQLQVPCNHLDSNHWAFVHATLSNRSFYLLKFQNQLIQIAHRVASQIDQFPTTHHHEMLYHQRCLPL